MPRLEEAGVRWVSSIKAHSWRGVIKSEFGFKAAGVAKPVEVASEGRDRVGRKSAPFRSTTGTEALQRRVPTQRISRRWINRSPEKNQRAVYKMALTGEAKLIRFVTSGLTNANCMQ